MQPRAGCLGTAQDVFSPRVMGNCPYVLSVGATTVVEPEYQSPGAQAKLIEVAAEGFASGGGFSNVFDRPKWQDKHVRGYLQRANMSDVGYVSIGPLASALGFDTLRPPPGPGKVFNMEGRGYPDVAALGESYRVVLRGYPNRIHGTSVSTPIWASVLTLINEERLAAGKSTVGFVHQVLAGPPFSPVWMMGGANRGRISMTIPRCSPILLTDQTPDVEETVFRSRKDGIP
jgi:tripeptidyl-peptidase-1